MAPPTDASQGPCYGRGMRRVWCMALVLTACGDDGPGGDTGGSTAASGCESSACGESSTAADGSSSGTATTSTASTDATTAPGESSSEAAGSSSGGPTCPQSSCGECFACTYDDACADAHAQCSVDPQCSIALICVRDCLEQSEDPATCVAGCSCPSEGAFQTLLTCATTTCTANASCPALAC